MVQREGGRPGDVAGLLLAAGRGERFGSPTPKPLILLGGRTLLDHALGVILASGVDPVFVVVGNRGEEVTRAVAGRVPVIENPRWAEGIASSLRAGIEALEAEPGVVAVCIGLADQPRVGPDAYRRLAAAHAEGARLAVATYDGVRANPVLLDRSLWDEARALEGDVGARVLMTRHEVVEVPCDDTGSPADVDTPDDLRSVQGSDSQPGTRGQGPPPGP